MKKLFLLLSLICSSAVVFAQAEKKTTTTTTTITDKYPNHECYYMKAGILMHCLGTSEAPQKENVKFVNGSTLDTKGVITSKDGKVKKLAAGQCVSNTAEVGKYDEIHAALKQQPVEQPKPAQIQIQEEEKK
jgi:hypothetical protein